MFMKKTEYKINRKNIPTVKLISKTDQSWYNYDDEIIVWSGYTGMSPSVGFILYNINETTELIKGYYKWSGSEWELITENVFDDFYLPVFLNQTIYDMGIMVGFDGDIEQIEQKSNFTYNGDMMTVTVYNTINVNRYTSLFDATFTIDWGDGFSDVLSIKSVDNSVPYKTHNYNNSGLYTISITMETPWDKNIIRKDINIPFKLTYGFPIDFGELAYTIPYVYPEISTSQQYLEDYRKLTGNTENTSVYFTGIGKSRLYELKKYGGGNNYTNLVIESNITGYTLDNLYYFDMPDGNTIIYGTTEQYYDDEVYNGMITRNEYFIGFVDDPLIFSDIFVERGKLGVLERSFRLSEIESTGELDIYGNEYFKVKKQ